jgi:3-methyl-2-oxobutanoate hydroxymethyltransferase
MAERVTTAILRQRKKDGRPVAMLTAYDCPMARMVDEAGIDLVLVGDSVGNVILGYDSTLPVTMEDMIHHVKAVCRGVSRAMVVADLPFMSYQISREDGLRNAGRFLKEGGAQAVKMEGGREMAEMIRMIVTAGIPVMGHLGLTPQAVHQLGGYRVQGRDPETAQRLLDDARILQQAGVFAIVLECIPSILAQTITRNLDVLTIGIGAGPHCDGQVLVIHDLLGLSGSFTPKFVKKYMNIRPEIITALSRYREEVETGVFPGPEHGYSMPEEALKGLK